MSDKKIINFTVNKNKTELEKYGKIHTPFTTQNNIAKRILKYHL